MGRQESIARSVVRAVTASDGGVVAKKHKASLGRILALFSAFFSLYQLPLEKVKPVVFRKLRCDHWYVDEDDYIAAFRPGPGDDGYSAGDDESVPLHAIGDMGFSGSTFYSTSSQQYLVKSVPRPSEHSFFKEDLLEPYAAYMAENPSSLLVRICEFLACPYICLGRALRVTPSHHIVMENIMYGQANSKENWEHWDLKPTSYFYPERDIADGMLTSEATKNQLADEFPDKIVLSQAQADELLRLLERDTQLLADHNAVDYSLFLVRMEDDDPREATDPSTERAQEEDVLPTDPPAVPPAPPSWRTGVPSADGKHIYRAAVLDFFWAKHKVQPRIMTALVTLWNLLGGGHGHMSITTTPEEYRERFLNMVRQYVEVHEDE